MADPYARAAEAIRSADALVVTAGAGMGVDSGLPDFRGNEGFWKAYPPYARLGLSFVDAANPAHLEGDPAFGWGFYGHRLNLYRSTIPHEGFRILLRWIERFRLPAFFVTSNVGVDLETMRAHHVPRCPRCGGVSRPNILMFGDWSRLSARRDGQRELLEDFLEEHRRARLAVVELGARTAIPTIRHTSERLGGRGAVVRIDVREPDIEAPHVGIAAGAREGLERIDALLR